MLYLYGMIFINICKGNKIMNDTTDLTTLSVRIGIFIVIAGIFYLVLKSKKSKK